jgi:hypothetical protein
MFAGLPAFLPAALLGRLFNQNMHHAFWLALLLTALEMVIGIWMIRLGPKRTIAYLPLVLPVSALTAASRDKLKSGEQDVVRTFSEAVFCLKTDRLAVGRIVQLLAGK